MGLRIRRRSVARARGCRRHRLLGLKRADPSKIVSGFGGTLCLVASFIYISLGVAFAALPDLRRVIKLPPVLPDAACYMLVILLSLVLLFVPLALATRRVKNLEI